MIYKGILYVLTAAVVSFAVAAPSDDLNHAEDRAKVLEAARAIIANDPACALITVDNTGQPRSRTVTASPPEDDMTIWIATRHSTRKVQQIEQHPKVTLYFNDDAKSSYVSIMGRATLHNDLATKEAKNFYEESLLKTYWPDYPNDYLLIKVEPEWIEVTGHGISSQENTWRPQAVVLENM